MILLVTVIIVALAFDFTNGFHDTANAMATSIATGALKPKQAVILSAVLNIVGAFLSLNVAAAIASGIVDQQLVTLDIVLAGLCGGIIWNLITWLLGLPSSSSHALIGGIVGAVIAAAGWQAVLWWGVADKVVVPALISPVIALIVAATGSFLVFKIIAGVVEKLRDRCFRVGQIGSASLVSLAHGTNDAQKTMGIILLAMISAGVLPSGASVPVWVIFASAGAIALGTYTGGWRIIRTLGKGLTELNPPQGMAAETSSAATILLSSHFGMALSTTQVATGSILGSGVGRPGATVRWGVAGRMVVAWVLTLPSAAIVGAICSSIIVLLGPVAGPIVVLLLLVAFCVAIYLRSRKSHVDENSVNADWDSGSSTSTPAVSSKGQS